MSKINQIQNKLRELDGGRFQKIADAYLHRKGYDRINSLGSLVGSDKVHTGTPDTYIPLPNGKFIFAEHTTTQQDKLCGKIKDDLKKCFDKKRTGIPIDKIEEIVFCHTGTLLPAEIYGLGVECQKRGINLNIFGIDTISQDLHHKYPGIARDFLGVEVDTGQIVTIDEFVAAYNKNALAMPLDTIFHFREEDLKRVLSALESSSLVIVSGRPGVGKSRFALECCTQFAKGYPDYKVRCIYNRGAPDLYKDIRVHFAEPGQYLILVDDANRINRLEYVLQLLHDQNETKKFRIIATVRDYVSIKSEKHQNNLVGE
jgi:hypothetical protein